jgi:Holliday junction resolvase
MSSLTKVDSNQAEIATVLRAAGCSVVSLHAVGKGVPDLLVGRAGRTYLIEVKAWRNQRGEPRGLTHKQVSWHAAWRGQVAVVTTSQAALRAVGITPMEIP